MRYTATMDIRQIIMDRMEQRHINQARLSEMTRISRPRLNAYLRGHYDIYVTTLIRILEALDLDIRPARRRTGR